MMPIPWLALGLGALGSGAGMGLQHMFNRDAAADQNRMNMKMLKYQLEYDSPKNQMARFLEAGLNPNLVYGQGTPGNMGQPMKYPEIKPVNPEVSLGLGAQYQQLELMKSQTDLNKQKVNESGVKQQVMQAQAALFKANPLMKPEYVSALVTQLESVAAIKEQEATYLKTKVDGSGRPVLDRSVPQEIGYIKMDQELQILIKKFDLQNADQSIKAQVIQSKEFRNSIDEVAAKWATSAEITPQHIYQFIMLLLGKML